MKKSYSFAMFLIMLLLSSCSDKLTREKAAELIKLKLQFPIAEKVEFPKYFNQRKSGQQNLQIPYVLYGKEVERLMAMQQSGLITMTTSDQSVMVDFFGPVEVFFNHCECALTDAGQKYFIDYGRASFNIESETFETIRVKLFDTDFGEITGMVEQEQPTKSVTVKYTIVKKNATPFAQVYNINMSETLDKSETFVKYDDGWRIE